jgi:hypothetical protein
MGGGVWDRIGGESDRSRQHPRGKAYSRGRCRLRQLYGVNHPLCRDDEQDWGVSTMWLCRYCAAHVKDEVLNCPSCGTPAPARLQPELAEHVSNKLSGFSPPDEIYLLVPRGIPSLEKQAWGGPGAVIGFSLPFFLWLLGCTRGDEGESFLLLLTSLFCGFTGALCGGGIAELFRAFSDLFSSLLGRKQQNIVLPPHAALAKTEALGQQPPAAPATSDNITPGVEQIHAQSDTCFGIQSEAE